MVNDNNVNDVNIPDRTVSLENCIHQRLLEGLKE